VEFVVVIPARYASTRLPGKPLADIGGKPMVVHVADRARASGAAEVIVATDHPDIAAAVVRHGHQALMTRTEHATGTDRIAEISAQRRYPGERIVVNVQGDEPLIEPDLIRGAARQLANHPDAAIATACFSFAVSKATYTSLCSPMVRPSMPEARLGPSEQPSILA